MKLTIQILEKKYDKTQFHCGYSLLDDYLKKQAKQDVLRNLSACFVLADHLNVVKGYYTLSSNSIGRDNFPEALKKKLPPSYSHIPTILLGRLAIDNSTKGKGYGEILMMDALERCLKISESLGTVSVIVDPIDEIAKGFYGKYGFILIPGSGKMMLPMKTIKDLFS